MRLNGRELVCFARSSQREDKHGWLLKRGVVNTGYKRRWFVLKGNLLFYYKTDKAPEPTGVIILERCRVETCHRQEDHQPFAFRLIFDGVDTRAYELAAESEDGMMEWMKTISEASYELLRTVVDDLKRRIEEAEATQAAGLSQLEDAASPTDGVSPPAGMATLTKAAKAPEVATSAAAEAAPKDAPPDAPPRSASTSSVSNPFIPASRKADAVSPPSADDSPPPAAETADDGPQKNPFVGAEHTTTSSSVA